jgi:hypothetical protein
LARLIDPVAVTWVFAVLAFSYYWIYFLVTFVTCGFGLAQFRHACLSGTVALSMALVLGILVHQTLPLTWRIPAYAAVMAAVIVVWLRFRAGADMLRMLVQSRVPSAPRCFLHPEMNVESCAVELLVPGRRTRTKSSALSARQGSSSL